MRDQAHNLAIAMLALEGAYQDLDGARVAVTRAEAEATPEDWGVARQYRDEVMRIAALPRGAAHKIEASR